MSLAPSDIDNAPTVLATAPPPARISAPRSRTVQIIVLLLVLAPMGYLIGQSWEDNRATAEVVATERAAAAHARPLNSLLAALVDAQYTAARSIRIDDSGIRASIAEVDRVDRAHTARLRIDQRWDRINSETEDVLRRNPVGASAVHAFAVPIAMVRELLAWLADSSQVARDSTTSSHLVDVGLKRGPEVLAIAGELSSLAHTSPADPRVAILRDRISRAAQEVNAALGAASLSPDLPVLGPLDEFLSSSDALSRARTPEDVELANGRVRPAGVALEAAAINAYVEGLDATTEDLAAQRRTLLLAGGVSGLAALALVWLILSRARVTAPAAPDTEKGAGETRTERRTPNVIDARELLARR